MLSVQRALLGMITPSIRAITIGADKHTFTIRAIFDRTPTEADDELLKDITSEVCADFPEFTDFKEEAVFCRTSFNELQEQFFLEAWVFVRREV